MLNVCYEDCNCLRRSNFRAVILRKEFDFVTTLVTCQVFPTGVHMSRFNLNQKPQ
jgi:hypothetical protein